MTSRIYLQLTSMKLGRSNWIQVDFIPLQTKLFGLFFSPNQTLGLLFFLSSKAWFGGFHPLQAKCLLALFSASSKVSLGLLVQFLEVVEGVYDVLQTVHVVSKMKKVIIQLISYKRYLVCTLVQWRLSIYSQCTQVAVGGYLFHEIPGMLSSVLLHSNFVQMIFYVLF